MPRAEAGPEGRRRAGHGGGAAAARIHEKRACGSEAVLVWSRGEALESGDAARYIRLLDTGCGARIAARCEGIWPHYGEVVRNRKACIRGIAMRLLGRRGGRISQAVVLGAGLDPLSVEIAACTGYSVTSYEVDSSPARRKRRAIKEASAAAAECIRHVEADLEGAGPRRIASALEREGWRPDAPSLVVAEGISYYLRKETLRDLFDEFRAGSGAGHAILEYLRDAESVAPERARIADAVFGVFAEGAGVGGLSRYSDGEASMLVDGRREGGGARRGGAATVGPAEMERMRTSQNRLFPDDASGWISVCHGRL